MNHSLRSGASWRAGALLLAFLLFTAAVWGSAQAALALDATPPATPAPSASTAPEVGESAEPTADAPEPEPLTPLLPIPGEVRISGAIQTGSTVIAEADGWYPAGLVVMSYVWLIDGVETPGRADAPYMFDITEELAGKTISLLATGTLEGAEPVSKQSAESVIVDEVTLPEIDFGDVTVVGTNAVGCSLWVDVQNSIPSLRGEDLSGLAVSTIWYADGAPVSGALELGIPGNHSFIPGPELEGDLLTVEIYGSAHGYRGTMMTLEATEAVAPAGSGCAEPTPSSTDTSTPHPTASASSTPVATASLAQTGVDELLPGLAAGGVLLAFGVLALSLRRRRERI